MKSLLSRKPAGLIFFLLLGFVAGTVNAQTQRAVLIRGNNWQAGIPGFGSNMFSALFGEYEVETANAAKGGGFSVRASHESLHFDNRLWSPWPGIANAMQKNEDGSLLIGVYFDNTNSMGSWIIVFQFSEGLSGMEETAINRLIRTWNGRFGYFLSLAKNYSDVSLPAMLIF